MAKPKGSSGSSGSNSRSTAPSLSRLSSLKSARGSGLTSLGEMDPQLVTETIDKVVATGALISFGLTSDGGALSVFVKDGADSLPFYAHHDHELEQVLRDLNGAYTE